MDDDWRIDHGLRSMRAKMCSRISMSTFLTSAGEMPVVAAASWEGWASRADQAQCP